MNMGVHDTSRRLWVIGFALLALPPVAATFDLTLEACRTGGIGIGFNACRGANADFFARVAPSHPTLLAIFAVVVTVLVFGAAYGWCAQTRLYQRSTTTPVWRIGAVALAVVARAPVAVLAAHGTWRASGTVKGWLVSLGAGSAAHQTFLRGMVLMSIPALPTFICWHLCPSALGVFDERADDE